MKNWVVFNFECVQETAYLGCNMRVAYILRFYPTFVANEVAELSREGVEVILFFPFPLSVVRRSIWSKILSGGQRNMAKAYFLPESLRSLKFLGSLLLANLYFLIFHFSKYMAVVWYSMRLLNIMRTRIGGIVLSAYYAKIMEKQNVTHIHSHFAQSNTLIAMLISHLTDIPFSFTAHAKDIFLASDRALLRREIVSAKFAVTISTYNKEYLVSLFDEGIRSKIRVIHCGISIRKFAPGSPKMREEGTTILSVASGLVEKKGILYLIEACRILKDRGHTFRCLIVGQDEDGTKKREYEDLIERIHLEGVVSMMGLVPQEKLIPLYQASTMFVLPSIVDRDGDRDGVPVSLMEAMAAELPVISTHISGIPELIEDEVTGLLVNQRDPELLADAMERIMNDDRLKKKLGENGRKKVIEEFDISKNCRDLRKLFEEKDRYGNNEPDED